MDRLRLAITYPRHPGESRDPCHQLELLSESRRPVRKIMTAAAYGSRIGARVARLSGTTWVRWHGRDSAFSRHDLPEVCWSGLSLIKKREQGMPGARCTRGLVCKVAQRNAHTSIQVQRRQSGIPCAMV